jgi:AraC-like DNA-binding protein
MKTKLVRIEDTYQRLGPTLGHRWNSCGQPHLETACCAPEHVVVMRAPLPRLAVEEFQRLLDHQIRVASGRDGSLEPDGLDTSRGLTSPGIRFVLAEDEGLGYTEFFRLSDYMNVSITSAQYTRDTWINVEGECFFKLRVLFSGTLLSDTGAVIVRGPQAGLYLSGGNRQTGYYIKGCEPLSMVVLHCRPALLTRVLGLNPSEVPAPLDTVFGQGHFDRSLDLDPFSDLFRTAQCILESQQGMLPPLRRRYREALSLQLLMQLLKELDARSDPDTGPPLSGRDIVLVMQARDYLSRNFVNPPTIPSLARRVGISQTKLKAGFRELTQTTIYEFILKSRMEMATSLLRSGNYRIADVAYKVGYEYPANFTHAFKKHYGSLPREYVRRSPRKLALTGSGLESKSR